MPDQLQEKASFEMDHSCNNSEKKIQRNCYQPRAKVKRDEDDNSIIAQIDKWLAAKGYTENITVNEAADKFGISVYRIKRIFETHYKMHFKEYKNHLRNEEAKRLLSTTQMSLADISREVGYNDTSNFRKEFENEVKVSPKEYRAQSILAQLTKQ